MSAPVGWGFLGAGQITRSLAPAVHAADGAELVAVGARDAARAQALGPSRAYASYEAVLDDPRVEAVYIALANDDHRPWTERALAAGKHVLCEKPLGLTAAEVRAMADAARAADRLVVEAVWNRWHPRTRRAEALLRTGAIGQVERVEAGFGFAGVADGNYRLDPARGGGALYDVGCYAVAAAFWATGWPQLDSCGATRRISPEGVDLATDAVLALGGSEAFVRCAIDDEIGQWVRVEGSAGSLALGGEQAFTSLLQPTTLTVATAGGSRTEHFAPVDAYQLMLEHVSAAVRGQPDAYVVPLDESVQVADALDRIRAT